MRYAISLQIVISFACLLLALLLWSRGPVVYKENLADLIVGNYDLGTSPNVIPSFVDDLASVNDKPVLLTADKIMGESASPKFYVVKSGDTLGHIAQRFELSVAKLKAMNELQSDVIAVGRELIVSETR